MRALVFLAVLGVCSAFPFIGDTPEVAAEKARFFQAYRAAEAAALPQYNYSPQQAYRTYRPAPDQQTYRPAPQQTYRPAPVQPKWTGPVAATIPAGVDGRITPVSHTIEVASARDHFFNTYRAQLAATIGVAPKHGAPVQYHASPSYARTPVQPKWTGPVAATIPAGVPGSSPQVADTHEVNAAKEVFFNTYQRQAASVLPPSPSYYY